MSKTFRPYQPDQMLLMPVALQEWLPSDHLAYFISDVVDQLDLGEIESRYKQEERGYPPYHPVMMVKVLVYAYCVGVPSSRRIEKRLHEDIAFRVLAANNTPDFRTISDFRKDHLVALGGLFLKVLELCQQAGLAKLGHVSLDGTKMKANASKHKAMSYGRMKEKRVRLEAEVEELLKRAQQVDEEEDQRYGKDRRGDELPAELAFRESRLKKIREAQAALEEEAQAQGKEVPEDKSQRNFTDPDSRIMPGPGGKEFHQSYNCQAAVDSAHQVIVAADVTKQPSDHGRPQNSLLLEFKIAINRLWPGEKLPQGHPRWGPYSRAFHPETHTTSALIDCIRMGYSFSPVMRDGHRKQENFESAQHIGLDDDRGIPESSIDALAQEPFLASYAAFLYETLSSTPEHPKSRILFLLDQAITDAAQYREAQQSLGWLFSGTDRSCHEHSRFFYGTKTGRVLKLENILPWVTLQAEVVSPFVANLQQRANVTRDLPPVAKRLVAGTSGAERYISTVIQQETVWLASRSEGSGERHLGLLVAAIKLQSLKLSDWLPAEVRAGIDPVAILLPAASANGYVAKYGEVTARRTISDGMGYARPRPNPDFGNSPRPQLRWSGGQWVKAVRV